MPREPSTIPGKNHEERWGVGDGKGESPGDYKEAKAEAEINETVTQGRGK